MRRPRASSTVKWVVLVFFPFPAGSVCESERQALLAPDYNPCHRHEQKYILKTSISSLSFECQWELKIARMSRRFTPGSVMFDADAPQISIFCAFSLHFSSRHTLFFFLNIYLSPSFLAISYLSLIGPYTMHTSPRQKVCFEPGCRSDGSWIACTSLSGEYNNWVGKQQCKHKQTAYTPQGCRQCVWQTFPASSFTLASFVKRQSVWKKLLLRASDTLNRNRSH